MKKNFTIKLIDRENKNLSNLVYFSCKGKHLHWCDFIRGGFINPLTGTVYIPYNEEYYNDFLIKHECGHLLQIKEWGVWGYLTKVSWKSILSFTFDRKNHMQYWYELDATERGCARNIDMEVKKVYE